MNEFELFPEEQESSQGKRSAIIQSVSVAARFLTILSDAGGELALSELARRADTSRSTAHRYMQSLAKERLARQDKATGFYELGPAALSIGISAMRRIDAVEIAARHMRDLARDRPFSAGVALWTDRGPVLVRWHRNAYFVASPLALGDVLPLDNTACGWVFQAYLPQGAVNLARQNQPEHFRGAMPAPEDLEVVRRAQWCEKTSHLLPNVTGQAAPVFDAQNELICVVTAITDLDRLKLGDDRWALQREAQRINEATGAQWAGAEPRG